MRPSPDFGFGLGGGGVLVLFDVDVECVLLCDVFAGSFAGSFATGSFFGSVTVGGGGGGGGAGASFCAITTSMSPGVTLCSSVSKPRKRNDSFLPTWCSSSVRGVCPRSTPSTSTSAPA